MRNLTSESKPEPIHECYDNEPGYSMKEIKKAKEKNISIIEKVDVRDDATRLANRA